jgi:hypothetical protein
MSALAVLAKISSGRMSRAEGMALESMDLLLDQFQLLVVPEPSLVCQAERPFQN